MSPSNISLRAPHVIYLGGIVVDVGSPVGILLMYLLHSVQFELHLWEDHDLDFYMQHELERIAVHPRATRICHIIPENRPR